MEQIRQRIIGWDESAILRIIARRGKGLTRLMRFVTKAGDGYLWAVLSAALFFVTDAGSDWLLTGLLAFAIELSLYKTIKQLTTRKRPCHAMPGIQNLVEPPDEFSFPSGHTAAATVAALLFSAALPALAPGMAALALLIGVSRVYLGVHYPSDVLMGVVLGSSSYALASFLV